jgi:2-amino-4-hydroxy-6-hydroxymethyldihydropteridine diphosphokinase
VEYDRWAPFYHRIAADFGFSWEREELAARVLENLLRPESRLRTPERLGHALSGRTAIVVGLAPGAPPPPLHSLGAQTPSPALIAADGATERCLAAGLVPDLIVTDLDGPVAAEITANARGALVLVHAHGDNRDAVRRWVPEFPGAVGGSWAGPPRGGLVDYGGFTDGDRAAFLAAALGAREVLLSGFDFERLEPSEPSPTRKLRKLAWARSLLSLLAAEPPPITLLGPDGRRAPFPLGVQPPSTQ